MTSGKSENDRPYSRTHYNPEYLWLAEFDSSCCISQLYKAAFDVRHRDLSSLRVHRHPVFGTTTTGLIYGDSHSSIMPTSTKSATISLRIASHVYSSFLGFTYNGSVSLSTIFILAKHWRYSFITRSNWLGAANVPPNFISFSTRALPHQSYTYSLGFRVPHLWHLSCTPHCKA